MDELKKQYGPLSWIFYQRVDIKWENRASGIVIAIFYFHANEQYCLFRPGSLGREVT